MNRKIIALIGESASGKSTIEKELCSNYDFRKAVSHTTRAKRKDEAHGVDYWYVTIDEFLRMLKAGELAEHTNYNGWYYAVAKEELNRGSKPIVIVIEPYGFRQLKKIEDLDIVSFYVRTSWRTRIKRLVDRGDDIMELFRRIISDMGVFQGIADEVDYVVDNEGRDVSDVIYEVLDKIKHHTV